MKNKKMKLARIEKDMKQADLAEAIGVTRQTIGLIEAGDYNPNLNLCVQYAKSGFSLLVWGLLISLIVQLLMKAPSSQYAGCFLDVAFTR